MDLITKKILNILKNNGKIISIIQTIGLITTENLMLTGGVLRNIVWNYLHNYEEEYELEDCDIIFYNSNDLSKTHEEKIKNRLKYLNPKINWSVKNQARMHIRNGHNPYNGINDALSAFPETCSAVAIDKNWTIISPYGLNDLLLLIVKPTKFCLENEIEVYQKRIKQKNWMKKWTNLEFYENSTVNRNYLTKRAKFSKISYNPSMQFSRQKSPFLIFKT